MGQAALDRLEGVIRVEKGFFKSQEINTVDYDPATISVGAMEKALQQAGTFLKTLPAK